jgi:hypothetical protein
MNIKILLAVALAAGLSAPAIAGDDNSDQDAPKEKKICRTETVTGSLISKRRICMTKAEWDRYEQANREQLDRYTSRQNSRPGDQSNPAAPH